MEQTKKNRPVMLSERSHEHLAHISRVTGISQKKILENFINELVSLAVEYDHATLRIDSSILNDSVTAVLHGYGNKLQFGTCKTEFDLTQISTDKINEDLKKKAMGIDI